jgi:hypothetical protein
MSFSVELPSSEATKPLIWMAATSSAPLAAAAAGSAMTFASSCTQPGKHAACSCSRAAALLKGASWHDRVERSSGDSAGTLLCAVWTCGGGRCVQASKAAAMYFEYLTTNFLEVEDLLQC